MNSLLYAMRALATIAIAATCINGRAADAAGCERPPQLRFSLVPQNDLQKDLAELQPLFKDLQAALGVPVETIMPSSYGAVVEGLLGGAVHIAQLGPAAYVAAQREDSHITPFASYYRKTNAYQDAGPFYHALLIVREDGQLNTLESLQGKRLALVDPDSTSGALVPRHVFSKVINHPLESYFSRIVYSGSHDQSARKVAEGRVDAAFVGSGNLASYMAGRNEGQVRFRILWRSSRIPLDPFVYRGQLCASIREKIHAAFFGQDGKQNRALLDNLQAVRFVPVTDKDYDMIRGMR